MNKEQQHRMYVRVRFYLTVIAGILATWDIPSSAPRRSAYLWLMTCGHRFQQPALLSFGGRVSRISFLIRERPECC